jgi:hypothetical protein
MPGITPAPWRALPDSAALHPGYSNISVQGKLNLMFAIMNMVILALFF